MVFLVARVLEARRTGLGESEAISEGLARTAGLITSAAAIMIVVFAGFTLGDFLVVEDARLHARRGCINGCNPGAHGHRPGAAQSRRRLELVALGSAFLMARDCVDVREADDADNEALLTLTRATPMAGTISLRIDRDPDFFALLRLRGAGKVFVAARGQEVVGCISAALRTVYVGGVPETIAYVGDMKVHPKLSGSRVALRLIQALESSLRGAGIDVCFSVVAEGNARAMPLFEGRLGIPRWIPLGRFLVDQFLPTPFRSRSAHYRIEAAEPADLPALVALLDRFHRSRQFAPQLPENEIADALTAGGTFVARTGNRIAATLTLADMGPIKRNVLLNAPAAIKGSLAILRIATAPLPGFIVPKIGDALRLLSVRYAACDDAHHAALAGLFHVARAETFRRRFTCLAIGLHERDPLRILVRGIPGSHFNPWLLPPAWAAPVVCQSWQKVSRPKITHLFEEMEKYSESLID